MFGKHRLIRRIALAAAIASAPLAASAATMVIYQQLSSSAFGGNGYSAATIKESALLKKGANIYAGGFAVKGNLNGNGIENFTAWCLDIATTLRLSSSYRTTTTPFASGPISKGTIENIARLFETGYKGLDLTKASQSAGFQLALWEVMYETTKSFSLYDGNFSASNSTKAIERAQKLLAGMSGPITRRYSMTYLESYDVRAWNKHYSQHLVTVQAVPLPAGGLLLIGALGALAALRGRKAA